MRFKRTILGVWTAALLVSAAAIAAPYGTLADDAAITLIRPAASPAQALSGVANALNAGEASAALQLASLALDRHDLDARERAHLLLNRGLAHQKLGSRTDAIADFTAALRMKGLSRHTRARALFDRGVVQDELSRPDKAIADYTAALKLAPRMASALNNRANAYRNLGRLAEARRDYQASLAAGNSAPQFPDYGLGQIAEKQGNPLAAQNYYRAALAADPDYIFAKQRLTALSMTQAAFVLHPPTPRPHIARDDPPQSPPHKPHDAAIARVAYHPADFIPELRPAILGGFAVKRRARVQLGAYRSEGDAAEGWNKLSRHADGLLAGLTPQIVSVDLPGRGRFYRLRAGPVAHGHANALCRQLEARGLGCFPVRD